MQRFPILVAASVAVAFAAAGCGGTSKSGPDTGGAAGSSSASGSPATVAIKDSKLGKILVDGSGRSLYLFEKDKGTKSSCFDACARVWPPFTTTGKPRVGTGASAQQLGTTTRKDGKTEVTYHGHPLYHYAADTGPGDTAGQKLNQFGAEWYVLSAHGDKVENGS